MTLKLPPGTPAVVLDEPRLHALVIGVADYPHLPGGSGQPALDPLNLSQVTTPEFTARAITEWLLTKYTNPVTPLGSVDLLLSAPSAAQEGLDAATMDTIEKAVNAWVKRASSDSGNIAFLYFCGHGLAKADLYLLPEDFGDPDYSQWKNCINFDGLRLGLFASCKAERQVLFVDACRETPFGLLTKVNVEGRSLVDGDIYGSTVQTQAQYFATTEGKQAYGPSDDVTYFGQAVLKCLDGLGAANDQGGSWAVDTHALSSALGKVMGYFATKHGQPLQCGTKVEGKSALLHVASPKVLTSIGCSTPAATAAADIVLQRAAVAHHAGVGDPKPLELEVVPGEWRVTLQFPDGVYQAPAGPFDLMLLPPLYVGVPHP